MFSRDVLDDIVNWADNIVMSPVLDMRVDSEQKFEVIKGEFKTVLTVKFNKSGFPLSCNREVTVHLSEKQKKMKDLNKLINEAVDKKDYKMAAKLQEELEILEKS